MVRVRVSIRVRVITLGWVGVADCCILLLQNNCN